jgi:glycine hydroxymethyltransferase
MGAAHFSESLAQRDPTVHALLQAEQRRQSDGIELIASENIVSQATLDALGTAIVNKTVEGYPGRRYYGGAEYADGIETLALERARELFDCAYANVQPHSGSQANLAVFLAFLKPGDTVLSMDLSCGGHLSHGSRANLTGKWFNIVHYGVRSDDGLIDIDEVRALAKAHQPKMIICGGSAYPRVIDFAAFRAVADEVDALLLADMAHFAGLVAGGVHSSPLPHAHVVTATTYKNLRGVRGGLVLSNDTSLARKLDSAVFPGVQGSVILNAVAAKAVCLGEALTDEFKDYAAAVLDNARTMAGALVERNVDVVTGGTDTPLMLVDLRSRGITGAEASESLERAGLVCNKNSVPGDTTPPTVTSGLRFGVSAGTTRGFRSDEFSAIGHLVADVLDSVVAGPQTMNRVESEVIDKAVALARRFPIYVESV